MSSAYKIERYSYTESGWRKKHFLDLYYHDDGTILFNFRRPVNLNDYATNHDLGLKLTWQGNPWAEWREIDGVASEKLPQKRNKQEADAKRGREQDNWEHWYNLFKEGKFDLEATIRRNHPAIYTRVSSPKQNGRWPR